jgi:hypothetical protein
MQKLNVLQRLGPGLRGYFEEVIQLTNRPLAAA